MRHFPKPYLIYVADRDYGTYQINDLKYKEFKPSYSIQRSFRVFSDYDSGKRFGDYYDVVYERPTDRFYFFYINLSHDLVNQLNLLRHRNDIYSQPKPLQLPPEVHDDVKNGRAKIMLDYSTEGIPGELFNQKYLRFFLGQYAQFTILAVSDYRCGISEAVPAFYRNYWERQVSSVIRWGDMTKNVAEIIDPKIKSKQIRPYKCLMKNRILRSHRLALAYAISQDPDLSRQINYSFSSKASYHEEDEKNWLQRCLTNATQAAKFLDSDIYPILDYAQTQHTKNLDGEEGLDLNINQGPVYEDSLFEIHSNAYFQLVTETNYQHSSLFYSEKTFQPILMKQPFITAAEYGSIALMREFGYDVFDDIIDHSYDLEKDPTERMSMLLKELRRLCAIDDKKWAHGLARLAPRFEENLYHLIHATHRHNDLEVFYRPRRFPNGTTRTPGQSE
jgi:hypothetical protein